MPDSKTATSANTIPPQQKLGATSLVGLLFDSAGIEVALPVVAETAYSVPPSGIAVVCSHCNRATVTVFKDFLTVVERHNSQYHKTVIPFSYINKLREESVY